MDDGLETDTFRATGRTFTALRMVKTEIEDFVFKKRDIRHEINYSETSLVVRNDRIYLLTRPDLTKPWPNPTWLQFRRRFPVQRRRVCSVRHDDRPTEFDRFQRATKSVAFVGPFPLILHRTFALGTWTVSPSTIPGRTPARTLNTSGTPTRTSGDEFTTWVSVLLRLAGTNVFCNRGWITERGGEIPFRLGSRVRESRRGSHGFRAQHI